MDTRLFEKLYNEGMISAASYQKITAATSTTIFSVRWEVKTLLYLGVLLLTTGLGILVYKNIDTIGHQTILLLMALICTGSFFYCFKNNQPFYRDKRVSANALFDYILLLGCCTFISFISYLQFRYDVFGTRYGLATFFPMIVLFFSAYYFDHLGVLSMAITNLSAWLGLTITPLHILEANDFSSDRIIFTGVFLGSLLIWLSWISRQRNFKRHFEFTYSNFGLHLLLVSCLAGLFEFSSFSLAWALAIGGICFAYYRKATREQSFYYLLVICLYGYIAVSYLFLKFIALGDSIGAVYLGFIYFIVSAVGLIIFLMRTNKKFKSL
jgi:hypothetical protein